MERLINVRNVNESLNKEGPIENMVEVNIYYQEYRERMEIDIIGGAEMDSDFGDAMTSSPQS